MKLVIADHLPWDNIAAHCALLRAKVDGYLAFVDSGQLFRIDKPPVPSSPDIWITLAALHSPPAAAEPCLAALRQRLAERGITFEVRADPPPEGSRH